MSDKGEDIFKDPKKTGPGVWFAIHIMAISAKTVEQKKHFISFMKNICNNFKCMDCRNHCQEYIKNHPMEDFMHVLNESGDDIGMFKWSWIFHNAVNARLPGKKSLDWATAYGLYSNSDSGICFEGCGSTSTPVNVPQIITPVTKSTNNFKLVTRAN